MTDEAKIKAMHDALDEKIRKPQVPNDVTGKFELELKQGGVADKKLTVKV